MESNVHKTSLDGFAAKDSPKPSRRSWELDFSKRIPGEHAARSPREKNLRANMFFTRTSMSLMLLLTPALLAIKSQIPIHTQSGQENNDFELI